MYVKYNRMPENHGHYASFSHVCFVCRIWSTKRPTGAVFVLGDFAVYRGGRCNCLGRIYLQKTASKAKEWSTVRNIHQSCVIAHETDDRNRPHLIFQKTVQKGTSYISGEAERGKFESLGRGASFLTRAFVLLRGPEGGVHLIGLFGGNSSPPLPKIRSDGHSGRAVVQPVLYFHVRTNIFDVFSIKTILLRVRVYASFFCLLYALFLSLKENFCWCILVILVFALSLFRCLWLLVQIWYFNNRSLSSLLLLLIKFCYYLSNFFFLLEWY